MVTGVSTRPTDHALITAPQTSSPRRRRSRRRDQQQQRGDDEEQQQQETSRVSSTESQSAATSLHGQSAPIPHISVSSDGYAVEAARSTGLSLEIEPSTSSIIAVGKAFRKNRLSLFSLGRRHRSQHSPSNDETLNATESHALYVGGHMETDGIMKQPHHHLNTSTCDDAALKTACVEQAGGKPATDKDAALSATTTQSAVPQQAQRFNLSSWMYQRPTLLNAIENYEDEDIDSLRDFDASEWTPPDSSYGAAIPVAGWIPKSLRRSMEWGIIAAIAAVVLVLIVRTSWRGNGGGSGTKLFHYSGANTNNNDEVTSSTTSPSVTNFTDDEAFNETAAYSDYAALNDDVSDSGGN